jgi:hypothetical protein
VGLPLLLCAVVTIVVKKG